MNLEQNCRAHLRQILTILMIGPNHADNIKTKDNYESDVDGAVRVEISMTKYKLKVNLVWFDYPATAKCCQVSAIT